MQANTCVFHEKKGKHWRHVEHTPSLHSYWEVSHALDSHLPAADGKMGRSKSVCWNHVKLLDSKKSNSRAHPNVECKHCNLKFVGGATRIIAHLLKEAGSGVKPCTGELSNRELAQLQKDARDALKSKIRPHGGVVPPRATGESGSVGIDRQQSTLFAAFEPMKHDAVGLV